MDEIAEPTVVYDLRKSRRDLKGRDGCNVRAAVRVDTHVARAVPATCRKAPHRGFAGVAHSQSCADRRAGRLARQCASRPRAVSRLLSSASREQFLQWPVTRSAMDSPLPQPEQQARRPAPPLQSPTEQVRPRCVVSHTTRGALRLRPASWPLRTRRRETSDDGDAPSLQSGSKAQLDEQFAEFARRQNLEVTRYLSSANYFAITGPRGRLGFRRGEDRKSSDLVHGNNALVLLGISPAKAQRRKEDLQPQTVLVCTALRLRVKPIFLLRLVCFFMTTTVVKHVDTLAHAVVNAIGIEPVLRQQQLCVTMRDEAIRNAHTDHAHLIL